MVRHIFPQPGRRWLALPTFTVLVLGAACSGESDSLTDAGTEPELASAAAAISFQQLSAGDTRTCGVATDNRAYCWGANIDGGLGDGTTTNRTRPRLVTGGLRFRQISAGGLEQTCAVTTENQAYCWGDSQLTPKAVEGSVRFRQVETKWFTTCGVGTDNRAYCWGNNSNGQLGDGSTTSRSSPQPVAGNLRFKQVTVGQAHACGVTTVNTVYCWGSNSTGQVGDSTEVPQRLTPTRVAGGRAFTQVAAGNFHNCAVTTGHRAFCWGSGTGGQLGIGKLLRSFWPRPVKGNLAFDRVTGGNAHTCGETSANRAYCWGENPAGGLGDGSRTRRLAPVPVSGGRAFAQVDAGDFHTCGTTSSGVGYCWGENEWGTIGDGTTTDRLQPTPIGNPS